VAEWLKATVLKTVEGASSSWVRIPPSPPDVSVTLGHRATEAANPVADLRGSELPVNGGAEPATEQPILEPGDELIYNTDPIDLAHA
jgi:hypothetical protein